MPHRARTFLLRTSNMTDQARAARIPPRVEEYLRAILQECADGGHRLVSVVLFGSAAIGGFSAAASDVDLLLVVPDTAGGEERHRLRSTVERVECLHGFREPVGRPRGPLEMFVERATANVRSFFVCTRGDLLSGEAGRILGLRPAQALFVDRAVVPSIVATSVTVWGEDLIPLIPMPPLRRLDVAKSFYGLFCQSLLSLAVFPLLPEATKYAMGALKRSLHNCFFCYEGRRASLGEEVEFFRRRHGPSRTLEQLLALRGEYRPSLAFVARCPALLTWLHLRTALDNNFPRKIGRGG